MMLDQKLSYVQVPLFGSNLYLSFCMYAYFYCAFPSYHEYYCLPYLHNGVKMDVLKLRTHVASLGWELGLGLGLRWGVDLGLGFGYRLGFGFRIRPSTPTTILWYKQIFRRSRPSCTIVPKIFKGIDMRFHWHWLQDRFRQLKYNVQHVHKHKLTQFARYASDSISLEGILHTCYELSKYK
jgi:hypothetical protein